MPGIKAAFIDIGFPQDAFLHFSDISDSIDSYSAMITDETEIDDSDDEENTSTKQKIAAKSNQKRQNKQVNLKSGQDVIVQITKEPVAKKVFELQLRFRFREDF